MKKTFPVNINGTVFYIDEDAYNLLNTYLDQLRKAFPGREGEEVISDIEARIAEHFSEIMSAGSRVISISDVNSVIEKMGRPADISDNDADNDAPEVGGASGQTPPPFNAPTGKHLYRDERNKVFGGVLSGLSWYLDWNVTIMRVLLIVLALCTQIWPLVVIYLIAWMVIPPARTQRQILEMTGRPVTPGNIGQTVLGTMDPDSPYNGAGTVTSQSIFSILGKIILAMCGIVAGAVGLGFVGVLIAAVCSLIIFSGWGSLELMDNLLDGFFPAADHPVIGSIGVILLAVAVAIPCIAIVWGACCALFNARGASKTLIITTVVLEVVLIVATVVTLTLANIEPDYHAMAVSSCPAAVAQASSFFSLQ